MGLIRSGKSIYQNLVSGEMTGSGADLDCPGCVMGDDVIVMHRKCIFSFQSVEWEFQVLATSCNYSRMTVSDSSRCNQVTEKMINTVS